MQSNTATLPSILPLIVFTFDWHRQRRIKFIIIVVYFEVVVFSGVKLDLHDKNVVELTSLCQCQQKAGVVFAKTWKSIDAQISFSWMKVTNNFSSEGTKYKHSIKHFINCTCTDLTQPVIVSLTVHIVPRPGFIPAIYSEFSTRFRIVKIVWLSFLPVLEV